MREVGTVVIMIENDHQVQPAARVGRSASKSSDTSGKVWSVYLSEAERQDRALAENWKGDTEGILIFVRIVLSTVFFPCSKL